jgi:Skp family chaperone for outer membrane proteins
MKLKTLTTFIAAASIVLSFSNQAFADKIAVIDVDKIIQESTAIATIQKKVEKKKSEYEAELEKKQKDLLADQKRIEDKKDMLSKEALEKETANFEKKENTFKSFAEKKQNSLKKAWSDGMNKVNEKVRSITAEIAKEKNIDAVIQSSQTLYVKDGLDITSEVLKSLNSKLSKVDLKFE